jgi:hypothetical protein
MPRMPTRRTTRGLPRRQAPGYQGVFGQSLFGGSGAGTPQQFQSTPYQGNSLTGSYQHAYDQARGQNENRYNRILGGYGELLGQPSPYQAQRMNVHDLYNRRTGATHANLVGRGLTASTVGMAPQALNERERQFSLADIGDKEARYKSDIAQDQLDFMERKTEAYPDYEQLERLSQGLGAGGRGLGGGGRSAAQAYAASWKPWGNTGLLARMKKGGGMEYARSHQKVGKVGMGGYGGMMANLMNQNMHMPVIAAISGGAPIEQQMFPGQYDMARRMMTPANLGGGGGQRGGGQRGGGQRGGGQMDEMSFINQARRRDSSLSVRDAQDLYKLYQKQQPQRQAGMGAPQQGARRGTPSAQRARQVGAYQAHQAQVAAWEKHQRDTRIRDIDVQDWNLRRQGPGNPGQFPAPMGPGPDRPGESWHWSTGSTEPGSYFQIDPITGRRFRPV